MGKRDTRRQLILAAERLLAERGIEGVSLREINLAAKQRNTSAAHYHFGSKDALINAIFEFRRAEMGQWREEMLDAIEQSGRDKDVRALAEALVMPLARELQRGEEASHYLEFLSHVFLTLPARVGDILRKYQAADARWIAMTARALPEIPRRILWTRLFLMGRHVVISLAVYQRRGLVIDDVGFEAYLSDMIDAVAGYMSAPLSPRTAELVQTLERESDPPAASPPSASAGGQKNQ